VLLIEQKLTIAMNISDRALVMGHGHIVFDGTPRPSERTKRFARSGWRCELTHLERLCRFPLSRLREGDDILAAGRWGAQALA
jgi:energy-coupling factor transporter ATP-binding protein EcfA2